MLVSTTMKGKEMTCILTSKAEIYTLKGLFSNDLWLNWHHWAHTNPLKFHLKKDAIKFVFVRSSTNSQEYFSLLLFFCFLLSPNAFKMICNTHHSIYITSICQRKNFLMVWLSVLVVRFDNVNKNKTLRSVFEINKFKFN